MTKRWSFQLQRISEVEHGRSLSIGKGSPGARKTMTMRAKTTPRIAVVILTLLSVGCAALSGSREEYYVCSYDTVWDASIETMKGQSVATSNKEKGLIETNWQEVPPTSERSYGIFGREGFGNIERARLTVTVKQMDDVASVNVLETRE